MGPFLSASLLLLTIWMKFGISAELTGVINTSFGPVQGEILKTASKEVRYSAFKGIRFGKPPIRDLRFKPPSFPDPWTEVLDATSVGSKCPQVTLTGETEGDEDCLFINIFSPVTDLFRCPDELKAVIFWIQGGSFFSDSGDPAFYGPDFLIENDVVVVTFNYRLGPLGFLTLNHPDATGNAGLKDQVLALKWVQQNAVNFHGDPKRVTILGHSGGGIAGFYHSMSDLSQGLFNNIISISGSPLNPFGYVSSTEAREKAIKLASLLGYNTTDKNELLSIFLNASAQDLVFHSSQIGQIFTVFGPVLEDSSISTDSPEFLSTCVLKKWKSGNFSQVPYILGFTREEVLAFIGKDYIPEVTSLAKTFAKASNTSFAIPSVYTTPEGQWNWPLVRETTNLLFKAGMERTQRYITAHNSERVYYFQMSFAPLKNSLHQVLYGNPEVGAAHPDTLLYIWWILAGTFPLDPKDPTSIAREKMTRLFTNFAKYSDPTPHGAGDPLLNITWPDYGSSQRHLEFDLELRLGGSISDDENITAIIEASEPHLASLKDCVHNE